MKATDSVQTSGPVHPTPSTEMRELTVKLTSINRQLHLAFERLRDADSAQDEDCASLLRYWIQALLTERGAVKDRVADLVADLLRA